MRDLERTHSLMHKASLGYKPKYLYVWNTTIPCKLARGQRHELVGSFHVKRCLQGIHERPYEPSTHGVVERRELRCLLVYERHWLRFGEVPESILGPGSDVRRFIWHRRYALPLSGDRSKPCAHTGAHTPAWVRGPFDR